MHTKNFSQLYKSDAASAGGKGASLGEMLQAGIPVPDGFVVLAPTFDDFLAETDLIQEIEASLATVDTKSIHTVEAASARIQDLIRQAAMPASITEEVLVEFRKLNTTYVAVRSSATAEDGADHAWAGQLSSYLNTTEDTLLERVQDCWASLFTPRAIFYRFEKGLHDTHISVAVVIQKMVNSEKSGIAFSVHPVTEDFNQVIIEAGLGLGEAIVSGAVTPDSYVVTKEPREIIDTNVNDQKKALYRSDTPSEEGYNEWRQLTTAEANSQVLQEKEIMDLTDIILTIEDHYGFPCDIEWAYEAGTFYIVQSRPITTLSKVSESVRQTFIKSYTRNFSIIMQQAWYAANKQGLIAKLDLKEYPYNPPYLYYMADGVEEVWENTRANRWILDQLILKFEEDKEFFPKIYKQYFDRLPVVEEWWKKEVKTLPELQEFLTLVFEGISDFVIIYAALLDDTVPQEYQDLANQFREKDVFFAECNRAIMDALNNIYPELGYLSVYVTQEELGQAINKDELLKRDKGFGLVPEVFQGPISFDDLTKKFPEYRFEIERGDFDGTQIKGQTAYAGLVRGVVRIVKRKDQVEQTQEGEIIVSPMTTPDMVPAMKKAAAFITDEGGITCHAAIIAREMQKPCIIGTKTASSILKDGDLVEVDADNGVINILKSNTANVPTVKDFELTFEGQGMPYIYEVALYKYYLPKNSVSIIKGGLVQEFMHKDTLAEMNQEGLALTPTIVQSLIRDMDAAVKKSREEIEEILAEPLSEALIKRAFANAGAVTRAYYFFDPHFFDGIFATAYGNLQAEEVVQSVQEYKNVAREYFNQVHFGEGGDIPRLLLRIGEQTGVSFEDLQNYNEEELLAVMTGRKVDTAVLDARKSLYIMQRNEDGSQWNELIGEDAQHFYDEFYKTQEHFEGEVLRGKVAHAPRSITRGIVKCVTRDYTDVKRMYREMEEMKEGEILVTQTTDPEMMPALRKAAAAVTDIGGMLSHTAITARELGIPCIVDTKFATQVLKDGDMVEVDADSGVVKILEREKTLTADLYQKLFQWPGEFSYFLSSYFMAVYKKHEAVSLHDGKMWQSFLPLSMREKTLSDGLNLYSSELRYKELSCGLTKGFEDLTTGLQALLAKESLAKRDIEAFLDKALAHYNYYSQTEFFYTDRAYEQRENYPSISSNFESFDELKLKGRQYLNEVALVPGCYLDKLLEKIGDQYGLSLSTLKRYSLEEVVALTEGSFVSEEVLGLRDTYFMEGKQQGVVIIAGTNATLKIESFLSKTENGRVLKGQIANKGKYIGKAKVLTYSISDIKLMHKQIEDMTPGEILVADTTAPEIILACKKAGAIVTNQGGMMSHAAIVSRELNIPCVVGTGFATELIKNGDVVEVDADIGKITILKGSNDKVLPIEISEVDDWEFYLEREQPLFVFASFIETYGKMLKAETGFGFTNQLHFYKQGTGVFYRSKGEMDAAYNYFEDLIITRDPRISVWLKRENEIFSELESYKNITDLEKILDTYLVATLFNPTVNYRLHASTANLSETEVFAIQHELEVTRSRSFYPFLMDNVMPYLFQKVGELMGVDETLVKNMTPSEMRSVIRGEGVVSVEELQKRENGCYFYLSHDSSTKFYYGSIKSLEKEVETVTELKGNPAFKGFVVGKVCIVNSTQNMDKFTEGDVLVSINTNPSLMPIIQKASAIVTDEGGITCHAAIVSRELQKPCIIGTKIATKVLKDGDMVEVNANTGIVKIIENE